MRTGKVAEALGRALSLIPTLGLVVPGFQVTQVTMPKVIKQRKTSISLTFDA